MKVFNEYITRRIESKCTFLFIGILLASIILTSCHRKIGVKPGERLEKANKCKCKPTTKGGIYSVVFPQQSPIYFYDYSFIIHVKG